ncbi:hypothetical protein HYALB_00009993 [Hymenoscyphus albidus]|uniref:Uncharacterized protein n=1 Tax=Hymenoscyphus albidus TaxID=595503 RepID=A0A9N9LXA9_9HELO|nr:hypothetical protein HYALB_00009993 [Hymenoscyphus albidus]
MSSSNPKVGRRPWKKEERMLWNGAYRLHHGLTPLYLNWEWKDIPGFIGKRTYQGQENYRSVHACETHYESNKKRFKDEYNQPNKTATQHGIPPRQLQAYEVHFKVKRKEAVLEENRRYLVENANNMEDFSREVGGRTQAESQAICDARFRMDPPSGETIWRWQDYCRGFDKGTKIAIIKSWWHRAGKFADLTPNPEATRDYTPPRLRHPRDPKQQESSSDNEESSSDDEVKAAANVLKGLSEEIIREMSEETQENLDEDYEAFDASGASLLNDPTNPAIALMPGPFGQPPESYERIQ